MYLIIPVFVGIEAFLSSYQIDGIHLYTLDFQAKGFYEKMGFTLVAEIKDWPVGITRYELIKYI